MPRRKAAMLREFLSDATERMQHHLVVTVATTFAVGFTAGALIGWMMRQKRTESLNQCNDGSIQEAAVPIQ